MTENMSKKKSLGTSLKTQLSYCKKVSQVSELKQKTTMQRKVWIYEQI